LKPNTRYWYQVQIDGKPWAQTPSSFEVHDFNRGRFRQNQDSRPFVYSFQTFPDPDQPASAFTFAIVGDPGSGTRTQLLLAQQLVRRVESDNIRFLLTCGDNIYMQGSLLQKGFAKLTGRTRMSGDEDDDWFTAFFLPYAHLWNRLPIFPAMGNHDSEETEEADDLGQVLDNFYMPARFPEFAKAWGLGQPGPDAIFYRFRFGSDVEFVAVDTSFTEHATLQQTWNTNPQQGGSRQPPLLSPQHRQFVAETLRRPAALRLVYGHHPPFCLGPHHPDTPLVQQLIKEVGAASGQVISLAGHEHNFQHHRDGNVHYLLSGAAGKSSAVPTRSPAPRPACCFNSESHFLLVTVERDQVKVRAIGSDGQPLRLNSTGNHSAHTNNEIVIPRSQPARRADEILITPTM
jgi:hypothetical protein